MSLLKRIKETTGDGEAVFASKGEQSTATQEAQRPAARASTSKRSQQADETFLNLKDRVQSKLLDEIGAKAATADRRKVREVFMSVLDSESIVLSRAERERLFESIVADILGLGPLELLLSQDDISEIMVNGPKQIFIEKKGRLTLSEITFHDNKHVMHIIERIVAPLGRRIDESSPMVDARLKDGSRVNAIIPPLALCGPTITIRKFKKDTLTIDNLIQFKSVSSEMADFLKASVEARLNLIVSGGTGSGKTTLLNILSNFIPDDERVITIENAAELQLRGTHVVGLESRPANVEGKGEVSIRDLVINSLRMRPERIIVGECRGGETLDMLQAMNTGHDGSMTTVHANTPKDAVSRIETMCLMAGMDLPARAIREQISAAVDIFVQASRLKDGTRKVVAITEIQGMEGDVMVLRDIFEFQQKGLDEKGYIIGSMQPTGVRPRFIERFEALNIFLPPNIFGGGS
jgi:pilus assembly protein CpaF